MSERSYFPFCEIVKQNDIKEALLLNLINPKIGGVLIDGYGGSAKSVICESLGDITDKKIVKLPLNISEDRLTGSIDIEKTMKTGNTHLEKGVLSSADNEILFIDDVALLPDNITDIFRPFDRRTQIGKRRYIGLERMQAPYDRNHELREKSSQKEYDRLFRSVRQG